MPAIDETRDADQRAAAVDERVSRDPGLDALLGHRRHESPVRAADADILRLVEMVDAAVASGSPAAVLTDGESSSAFEKPRRHRRTDWVSVIVAGVAAVIVAGTAVFTGVHFANTDPAAAAVEVLADDEASLAGAEKALASSTAGLEKRIETLLADAALVRAALGAMVAADENEQTADPASLDAAVQAVDAYRAALEEIVVPIPPEAYERREVDEESLESVSAAMEDVRDTSVVIDDAANEMRAIRAAVDALEATYSGQLGAFAASLAAYASAEIEAHPVAEQQFRDAVSAAATTVTTVVLDGASGAEAITAFRDAVLALREDDLRMRESNERDQSQDDGQQTQTQTQTDTGEPDNGTTDPGTTDPGTDSGTTDPGTTEP